MIKTWRKYERNAKMKLLIEKASTRLLNKTIKIPSKINYELLPCDDAQEKIKNIITAGQPALIARFGSVEARCTAEGIGIMLGARKTFDEYTLRTINRNAGVFPYGEEMALRFSEISKESAKEVDILGFWDTYMQDYLLNEVCKKDIILTHLGNLEPYRNSNPWSAALEGKKVLVIHPFKDSIESQYKKRTELFENPDVLPSFDLKVIKAVQTIAGSKDERFKDWEQALDYMYNEAMSCDFDVAIIGCGAYGMPLGAKLKQSGKIAIHLGGATQILFGIKGKRWESRELYMKLFNEHWVKPLETEKPASASLVENACYW